MPISDAIIFSTLTFGILSALMWLPILKYSKYDFAEVAHILEKRAEELKRLKEEREKQIAKVQSAHEPNETILHNTDNNGKS